MNLENNFLDIILAYKQVINAWKKRSDVMNGLALAWHPNKSKPVELHNKPYSFGDGTGTTGFCVSASQALLEDPGFQTMLNLRNAKAKLISIDLREQYFGYCFNGSQNIWHTAIFVEDSNRIFVIDITCRQFGNNFTDKDFWDFQSWQDTLRSPMCKHNITDFYNNPVNFSPVVTENKIYNKDFYEAEILRNLHKITNIDNNDRKIMVDFFANKFTKLNNMLLANTLTLGDVSYVEQLNQKLQNLPFDTYQKTYAVLEFNSKSALKNWLKCFLENDGYINMFLLTSKTIEQAKLQSNITTNNINIKNVNENHKHYMVLEFNNQFGIDTNEFIPNTSLLIPYNTMLNVTNIFNGALINDYNNAVNNKVDHAIVIEELSDKLQEDEKTNTTWLVCN